MALPVCAFLGILVPASRGGDARNFDDAALHAVQFLDQDEGWAVGDAGVIWHTINGGKDWERVPAPTQASLRSVQFLNPYIGWVAGREELTGGKGSVGVLLYTKDGGLKWHHLLSNALPGLNQVRFANPREGFALGDGSDQYPSGLFRTTDGGRSWAPVNGPRSPGWLAGDFQDGKTGSLVGAWGRLAKMRAEKLGTADVEALGGRSLYGVQIQENRGIAVGDGGAILASRSSGARWGYVTPEMLKLSREALANLDFRAVHYVGDHAWVAGRPGSIMLHCPNMADTSPRWEVLRTGHLTPLNAIYFQDEQRGWAVGELGCILATIDGGKKWTVQHRGGERAAVLFVHAQPAGIPLDTVALLGGEEGYLTALLRVMGPDPASAAPSHAADRQRLAAAFRRAGGAAGESLWQLPFPQHLANAGKQDLLESWNRLHGNRADKQLLRQMVLALRMWRPDVVITDHPDGQVTGSAAEALVAEALHEAFTQAADPRAFPEQLTDLGLKPWSVSKVYGRWHQKQGAQVVLSLTDLRRRLESTLRDFAGPARDLVADSSVRLPEERYYRLLDSRLSGGTGQRGLMDGISFDMVKGARRDLGALPEVGAEIVKAIRARRAFERIAERPVGELTDPSKTLAQLAPVLGALPVDQAANAMYAVASQYARLGQWVLAREAYILMVERYPAHPRSADAYRWLIQHNSSSEARRRHELGQFLVLTQTDYAKKKATEELLPSARSIRDQAVFLGHQEDTRAWYKSSLEIARRLAAFGPVYGGDPAVQFCLQAARRKLGEAGEVEAAERWYRQFKEQHTDDAWRAAAAAELWLTERIGPAPKPVFACRQTPLRPFLDGKLEDHCWKGRAPMVLKNAVGETARDYPTEAWLAYDQEFLYLAVRCRHPEGKYVAPLKPRKRDADLRPYDRISLLLDLDRDYSTYFHFQVDQRGCVFEDCWGDRTWDPRWFVAAHSDKTSWQVEAAIPLVELTGDRVSLGTAWACNVVRVLPGRGVQAWSTPANVKPRPEGMGLLIFSQDPRQGPEVAQGRVSLPKVP
jgi:photosystem II stability/assembly factor-like uncharacterized protein